MEVTAKRHTGHLQVARCQSPWWVNNRGSSRQSVDSAYIFPGANLRSDSKCKPRMACGLMLRTFNPATNTLHREWNCWLLGLLIICGPCSLFVGPSFVGPDVRWLSYWVILKCCGRSSIVDASKRKCPSLIRSDGAISLNINQITDE